MLAAERYVLGELQGEERERFEEHYFTCPDCARDVEELDLLGRGTKAVGASLPERPLGWAEKLTQWWARPQVGFVTASAMLVFLATSGYQAMQLQKAGSEEAEAVTAYALRPETRGEVPELRVSGKRVLVEVDLPGARGEMLWTLSGDEGKKLAEGRAAAPEPGQTLKLLLPMQRLDGSSQFLVEIHGASGGESYRFRFSVRKN